MPHQFTDTDGRVWQVELDPLLADEVREATGFDLYALAERKFAPLFELLEDSQTPKLLRVLFAFSAPADAKGKGTLAEFSRAMRDPDKLNEAGLVFGRAVGLFSRKPTHRQIVLSGLETIRLTQEKITKEAKADLAMMDPERLSTLAVAKARRETQAERDAAMVELGLKTPAEVDAAVISRLENPSPPASSANGAGTASASSGSTPEG
jgi:hypothetical protein